jgi:hypothetical protein
MAGTYLVAFVMVALAILGIRESLRASAGALYVIAGISLVPVGLYTLGAESVAVVIGISNVALLIAATLIQLSKKMAVRSR